MPFEQLRELVLEDPKLQNELAYIEDVQLFINRAIEMAKQHDIKLDEPEIREAMVEARQIWVEQWT